MKLFPTMRLRKKRLNNRVIRGGPMCKNIAPFGRKIFQEPALRLLAILQIVGAGLCARPLVYERRNNFMNKHDFLQRKTRNYSVDDFSSGAFFVTINAQKREKIFGNIEYDDYVGATLCGRPHNPHIMVIKWLLELEDKYPGLMVDYFVIMPDHIHFIVFLPSGHIGPPLSRVVGWFKSMTTNEYIRNVKKGLYPPYDKSVWQRGYFAEKIDSEQMLYSARKYIEENPIEWYYSEEKKRATT